MEHCNNHWRFSQLALGALAISLLPGCLAGAAGVVEASRSESSADPMGTSEYQAPDGTIGWHGEVGPRSNPASFASAAQRLGCTTEAGDSRLTAACPGLPKISSIVSADGHRVYRLCEPGTERMACRSAWEKIHSAMTPPNTAAR